MTLSPEFLLDPRNADFLAGKTSRPASDETASTMTLIGRVILLFTLVAGLICAYKLYQRAELLHDGVTTVAQVVDRHVAKGRRGPNYRLAVTYRTGSGEVQSASLLVSRKTYETHRARSLIGVRYLPARPNSVVQEDWFRTSPKGLAPLPWIGLLLVVSVGSLGYGAWLRRKDERLGIGAQILPGRVLRSWGESTRSGYWIHVRYEFETPSAGTLTGTSRSVRPDLAKKQPPLPGTPVALVFRDPKTHRLL